MGGSWRVVDGNDDHNHLWALVREALCFNRCTQHLMFPTSLCIKYCVPILQLKKLRHWPELHSLSGETGFLSGNWFPQPCGKESDTVTIFKLKKNNKSNNKAGGRGR